jgi:hypothetical protein
VRRISLGGAVAGAVVSAPVAQALAHGRSQQALAAIVVVGARSIQRE